MMYLTKKFEFCASHRYWNINWNEEKNRQIFGKYAHIHGHNYHLEVTIQGEISPQTGMMVNVSELHQWVKPIIEELDHRYLNEEVAEFAEIIPTTENLSRILWSRISRVIPEEFQLVRIKLWESADVWVEYTGGPEASAGKQYRFSAAHRLSSPHLTREQNIEVYGKCANEKGHGHNYCLQVQLTGSIEPQTGWVLPEEKLDSAVLEILRRWDHHWLDVDVEEFRRSFSTGEIILQEFIHHFQKMLPHLRLSFVRLEETGTIGFEYIAQTALG